MNEPLKKILLKQLHYVAQLVIAYILKRRHEKKRN